MWWFWYRKPLPASEWVIIRSLVFWMGKSLQTGTAWEVNYLQCQYFQSLWPISLSSQRVHLKMYPLGGSLSLMVNINCWFMLFQGNACRVSGGFLPEFLPWIFLSLPCLSSCQGSFFTPGYSSQSPRSKCVNNHNMQLIIVQFCWCKDCCLK